MSGRSQPRCYICRKHADTETPPPGGYLRLGRHFVVHHGPLDMSPKGTLLVEARRHFLDFGEMSTDEGVELLSILHQLFPALKRATGAERVYSLATMAGVPHFHLWLVPKRRGGRLKGVRYLASRHPALTSKAAEEAMDRVRRALRARRS